MFVLRNTHKICPIIQIILLIMLIIFIIPIILTKILFLTIKKNQTRKYFLAGGEKNQKTRKYYSPIQSPDKVLQRYTKPPQDIVV